MKLFNTPDYNPNLAGQGNYRPFRQTVIFLCCVKKCTMALEITMERFRHYGTDKERCIKDCCREANWSMDNTNQPWDGFMTCAKHPVEFEDHMDELDKANF